MLIEDIIDYLKKFDQVHLAKVNELFYIAESNQYVKKDVLVAFDSYGYYQPIFIDLNYETMIRKLFCQ